MSLFAIDIGNSFAHLGLVEDGRVLERAEVATALLASGDPAARKAFLQFSGRARGAAWCSVVPKANEALAEFLAEAGHPDPLPLTPATLRGLAIAYPHPEQLGQDRLANSLGAVKLCGAPVVAACLGTASVIDAVSRRGYEGGAIAPGLATFAEYLHEKTAQLPKIDTADLATPSAIGRSTAEAMKNGIAHGYAGMIAALVASIRAELEKESGASVPVVVTGGGAHVLREGTIPGARFVPDLGLIGLEEAYLRARG